MKWSKRLLGAGIVAGAAYAVWRVLDERARASSLEWKPQPFPSPPIPQPRPPGVPATPLPDSGPAAEVTAAPESGWVEPDGPHCPASHPVKAKLGSGIFHVPGGLVYDRTIPDRCYPDAAAAEADGLRASKR